MLALSQRCAIIHSLNKMLMQKKRKILHNKVTKILFGTIKVGILPLHSDTGQYYRKPLQERVCLYCSDNVIEDEYHFVVVQHII